MSAGNQDEDGQGHAQSLPRQEKEPEVDDSRGRILARREFFIASALAGVSLTGCETKPAACLDVVEVPIPGAGSAAATTEPSAEPAPSGTAEPTVCLNMVIPTEPTVCLEIAPAPQPSASAVVPKPRPRVCLKKLPPPKKPSICLSAPDFED